MSPKGSQHQLVGKAVRLGQGLQDRVKRGCGGPYLLGVAAQGEAGRDGFVDQISQVFQIQRRPMSRPVGLCGLYVLLRTCESRALWQESTLTDPRRKRRILTLQKRHDRVDGVKVVALQREHLPRLTRKFSRKGANFLECPREAVARKQREDHVNSYIRLTDLISARSEKPRQVGGRWVWSIQLGQGWDHQKQGHGHGLAYHKGQGSRQTDHASVPSVRLL